MKNGVTVDINRALYGVKCTLFDFLNCIILKRNENNFHVDGGRFCLKILHITVSKRRNKFGSYWKKCYFIETCLFVFFSLRFYLIYIDYMRGNLTFFSLFDETWKYVSFDLHRYFQQFQIKSIRIIMLLALFLNISIIFCSSFRFFEFI